MTDDERRGFLVQEYLQLQKTVEEFDARALTIKAWSVTVSGVGFGAAYVNEQAGILIVGAVSALVFWLVEALWKTNQQAYYPRINEIEDYFAAGGTGQEPGITPFRIARSWGASFAVHGGYLRAWRVMRWPHVMLPHIVVAAAGLGLLLFAPPV